MNRTSESGQATIELALCLPILAALLAIVAYAGGVATDHVRLWHAAREAARVAAVEHDPSAIKAAATAGGLQDVDVTIEPSPEGRVRGEPVTVSVSFEPAGEVPLFGPLVDGMSMTARATMRIERP